MTGAERGRSLRVAQVLGASTGGIGRHVAELTGQLLDHGHRVQVWCPVGTAEQHLAPLVARGLRIHARLDSALLGADLVHAHGYKATAAAVPLARLGRVPVVSTWHNLPPAPGPGRRRLDHLVGRLTQRLAARADLVLGASSDLVAAAGSLGAPARLGPVTAPRLGSPVRDRATVRAALRTPLDTVVVLTVGRLAPQKNLDLLLDAAGRLAERANAMSAGVEWWVAGSGPELARLTGAVAERGLPVRLLGHRDDVADLIGAADLGLLTSHWEARSLFAQEAMVAGLPLVTTRVGGMTELVGGAAVLVEPGDAVGLADAVRRLADDPERRTTLAQLGRGQARTWPSEGEALQVVLDAYADVLERHRGPSRGRRGSRLRSRR